MSQALKLIIKFFNIVGLNPYKQNKLSICLNVIMFTFSTLLTVQISLEIFLNWKGIETVVKVEFLPALSIITAKLIFSRLNNKQIMVIIENINLLWPLDKFGKEFEQSLVKAHKLALYYVIMFTILCITTVTMFVVTPIFTGERKLMYPGYEFCDLNTSPCYELQFWGQLIFLTLQIMPFLLGFDGLFVCCVAYAHSAIELIKIGLKKLNILSDTYNKDIAEIIDQHVIVLKFIRSVDRFYRYAILCQYIASLGNFIFCLYMLTSKGIPPPSDMFYRYTNLYVTFCFQFIMFCMGGTIIAEQTKTIADEAFYVNWWIQTNSNARKGLAFIIQVSQKGEKLTVGKLLELNLETFVTVLKNSLSMYMLLRTIEASEKN